jgi:hypothetical protein
MCVTVPPLHTPVFSGINLNRYEPLRTDDLINLGWSGGSKDFSARLPKLPGLPVCTLAHIGPPGADDPSDLP